MKKSNFYNLYKLFDSLSMTFKIIRQRNIPEEIEQRRKVYNFTKTPGFILFSKHCEMKGFIRIRKLWYYLDPFAKIRYEKIAKKFINKN